jgi:hypothetical protein
MPDADGNLRGQGWSRAREEGWTRAFDRRIPCPCGEPNPPGYPPCTYEKPCGYGEGYPQERWDD